MQRLEAARVTAHDVLLRTEELGQRDKVGGLVAVDAERTWVAAEVAEAAEQADVNGDKITAFLALGGGW